MRRTVVLLVLLVLVGFGVGIGVWGDSTLKKYDGEIGVLSDSGKVGVDKTGAGAYPEFVESVRSLYAMVVGDPHQSCDIYEGNTVCVEVLPVLSVNSAGVPVLYSLYLGSDEDNIEMFVQTDEASNAYALVGVEALVVESGISEGDVLYVNFLVDKSNSSDYSFKDSLFINGGNGLVNMQELLMTDSGKGVYLNSIVGINKYKNVVLPTLSVLNEGKI